MPRILTNIMLAGLLSATLVAVMAFEATASRSLPPDLTDLSLEDLMALEVTSAGKKSQKLANVAAAVFVITPEDIRRSGARQIPDLLRMVPGVEVAQIDANKWAISARGFNGRFANKLLVLIDGRTVYTPLFSGVYWDMQDSMLEDIERIEVIRGPGAALWGANAVNGIINIITKHAKDTTGALVSAGGGTEERGFGSARYGAKIGETTYFRLYGKYFDREDGGGFEGLPAADAWHAGRGGFRLDSALSETDRLTFTGDIFNGHAGQTFTMALLTPPFEVTSSSKIQSNGGHLLGRWSHAFSPTSEAQVQVYYDYSDRREVSFGERRHTVDLDFQHRFALGGRQEIIWGLGYRYSRDRLDLSPILSVDPRKRGDSLFSAFLQDDITLWRDRLHLIVGSKFEHNDYTGFEVQPNARLLYTPNTRHTLWASFSRAVRTPSRGETDGRINFRTIPPNPLSPLPLPMLVSLFGNKDFRSETLMAWELGYRFHPHQRFSLDLAAFYNRYDDLRAGVLGAPSLVLTPPPHILLPSLEKNNAFGSSYGVEAAADWRPLPWWRLQAAYSYIVLNLHLKGQELNEALETQRGATAHHQASLRSSMDLGKNVEMDLWLRYLSAIPPLEVGSYITLDARLAWRPVRQLELAVVGRNLVDSPHLEFRPESLRVHPTEVRRSVYGVFTWKF